MTCADISVTTSSPSTQTSDIVTAVQIKLMVFTRFSKFFALSTRRRENMFFIRKFSPLPKLSVLIIITKELRCCLRSVSFAIPLNKQGCLYLKLLCEIIIIRGCVVSVTKINYASEKICYQLQVHYNFFFLFIKLFCF